MKKVIAIVLVALLVVCTIGATVRPLDDEDSQSVVENEEEKQLPFMKIIDIPDIKRYHTTEQWLLSFDENEVEPINTDTVCSHEQSVCVGSMYFSYKNGKSATWDLYVYNVNGIEGVEVINQAGQCISFYGDTLTSAIINYNIELSRNIYVYPEGENLESYTVVVTKG